MRRALGRCRCAFALAADDELVQALPTHRLGCEIVAIRKPVLRTRVEGVAVLDASPEMDLQVAGWL
jgi:hypothetical protein